MQQRITARIMALNDLLSQTEKMESADQRNFFEKVFSSTDKGSIYQLEHELGKGATSIAYLALIKKTLERVCIKVISKSDVKGSAFVKQVF